MFPTLGLWVTCFLWLFLVLKQTRRFFGQMRQQSQGYCLLVQKKQVEGQGILVFQQGQKEWQLVCGPHDYLKLQPPLRGELILSQGEFYAFEVKE
ncbi:hypothetical protein ACYSNO_08255 [Enterococcus sp. LJL98]